MSQQYYGVAEAMNQHHGSSRSLQLSMSPAVRESQRNFPISRPQSQTSPVPDSESDKGRGGNARKRISLAVETS